MTILLSGEKMKLDVRSYDTHSLFFELPQRARTVLTVAELLLLIAEVILIFVSFHLHIIPVLAIDLLLLSPLKVGRALLYNTVASDPQATSLRLLFRYFRFRYFKTVWWRLRIWLRMGGMTVYLSLSTILIAWCRQQSNDPVIMRVTTCLLFLFLSVSVVILILAANYYLPSSVWCIYSRKSRDFFRSYKHVFGSPFSLLAPVYRYLVSQLSFFFLCPPIFIMELRIRQALVLRGKIEEFLQKETSASLERFKNM